MKKATIKAREVGATICAPNIIFEEGCVANTIESDASWV
jgi:hypothetical protein